MPVGTVEHEESKGVGRKLMSRRSATLCIVCTSTSFVIVPTLGQASRQLLIPMVAASMPLF
jgi:hypothetical protein